VGQRAYERRRIAIVLVTLALMSFGTAYLTTNGHFDGSMVFAVVVGGFGQVATGWLGRQREGHADDSILWPRR
jgi:Zn-dependent protease with chaperone function